MAEPVRSVQPAPFFAFRTATFPWRAFEAWTGEARLPGSGPSEADLAGLRERLRAFVEKPEVAEALFLASPDMVEALPHWLAAPTSEKGQRVERSLVKYVARMCGRATPFGLFAGCSVGDVAEVTRLDTVGQGDYIRHTRLDMDYLCTLAEALAQDPKLRQDLRFRPNDSLYRAAGRLRYTEGRLRNKSRSYHLVAVEETPYLLATLARAEGGATLRSLAEALVEPEVDLDAAEAYVGELVESQLLVPELQPAVTGPEPIHDLIRQLRALPEGEGAAQALEDARRALEAIDDTPLGLPQDRYFAIAEGLKALPAKVELNRLFQTDLVKPAPEATLGPEVVAELARGLELMQRLLGQSRKDAIGRFAEAFQSRYEGREVPLVEVLDEEGGIGFDASLSPSAEASPLLEGLAFPGAEGEGTTPWSAREAFLLRKVTEHALSGELVLRLEEAELKPFFLKTPAPLPHAFAAMAKVAATGPEALARGEFKVSLTGFPGPSGANLLGRFCHGDERLTREVLGYLRAEEARRPEAVHAEIVHLPEGRIGNVILRPQLREHEIVFLGRSGAPEEGQIPISDLLISVQGGRVVLRSRRLAREVLPRMTNAHNFSYRSLGIYRFLCMLQFQGLASGLSWSWGVLEALPFLPRLEVGRLVLAEARWRVEKAELRSVQEGKGAARWEAFAAWRAARRLPRFALLGDGDHKLPIDFENALSVESLLELVKGRDRFVLEELFPGPEDLFAEGPEGSYVHEIVVPFTRTDVVAPAQMEAPVAARLPRSFAPGSEWLYAKVYAGHAAVDQILRERLGPLIRELRASGAAKGWFFIRYGDPEWHLRLRFQGEPARLGGEVLPRLHALVAELQAEGLARKLVLDTYDRELERYGGDLGMPLSEAFFETDSDAVLALLEAHPGDPGADARWRLCLKGMDLLLDELGFELPAKGELMAGLRLGFLREFRGEGYFEHQLGDRFRKDRKALEALMGGSGDAGLARGLDILAARTEALRPAFAELRALGDAGKVDLRSLAGSYLHMHANRLLRSSQRAQELVLYDFLSRLYESQLARGKRSLAAVK
ncbi:MAG TPA: lantibiotic dehydratase [Holophagaceae bacterium]|nr:lantibiotic dehydratase [Holophagaceae bacterium]